MEQSHHHRHLESSWLDRDLYPFNGHFEEIQGCRVHYLDEGQGPVLLLLHGNPTWSFLYRDVIRHLRDRFRCIAPDYPGFGFSIPASGYGFTPAEHAGVIEELLLRLDLQGVIPVMQDWGGPIGLWVAGRHPGRFRGLVLGNTWAWPVTGDRHFERFSSLLGGGVGGVLIRYFNFFVNALIPYGTRLRKPSHEVMQAYRGPFPTPEHREPICVFPREIVASADFLAGVEKRLERIRELPTLIVWGDRDPAFRARERERFQASFPHHEVHLLRGAGHYIQEDAPEEISAAITNWAREHHFH